jgi:hypothetical protein
MTMEAVQEHFTCPAQEIENVPAGLIFNADESGFQEFVDVLSSSAVILLFPHPFKWKYFTMNLCSNLFMTVPERPIRKRAEYS